jgi:hypothetical protein
VVGQVNEGAEVGSTATLQLALHSHYTQNPRTGFLGGPTSPPSSLTIPTVAAPCAWRTIAGVIAVRAYLGGEDGRKRSRQLQRGFEAAAWTLSREPGVRRRRLGTRTANCFRGHARRLWCTHYGRCGSQRRGRTGLSRALPLALFPHPGRSLSGIAIGHGFPLMRAPVYRVPRNDWNSKSRLMLGCRVCVLSQKVNHFLVGGALYTSSMTD